MKQLVAALVLLAPSSGLAQAPVPERDAELAELERLLLPPRWEFQISGGVETDGDVFAIVQLGARHHVLKKDFIGLEATIAERRAALRADPTDAQLHLDLSSLLLTRSRAHQNDVFSGKVEDPGVRSRGARESRRHLLEAERILRARLAEEPSEELELEYVACLRALGRRLEAFELVEELTRRDPPSWRALVVLARHRIGSLEELERLASGSPLEIDALADLDSADELLSRAEQLAPTEPEPLQARILLIFSRLMRLPTGLEDPRHLEGLIDELQGCARRLRALEPEGGESASGALFLELAIELGRQVHRTYRGEPELFARMNEGSEKLDLAPLQAIVESLPLYADAELLERYAAAERIFESLASASGGSSLGTLGHVVTALGRGDPTAVLTHLRALKSQLPPGHVVHELAEALPLLLEVSSREQSSLQQRLAAYGELPGTRRLLHLFAGTDLCKQGLYEELVELSRYALSRTPHQTEAWLDLGIGLFHSDGGAEEARAALQRVVDAPRAADAASRSTAERGLALLAARVEDWEDAVEHARRAALTDSRDAHSVRARAFALARAADGAVDGARRRRRALGAYRRAAELYLEERPEKHAVRGYEGFDRRAAARSCLDAAATLRESLLDAGELEPATALRSEVAELALRIQLVADPRDPARRTLWERAVAAHLELEALAPLSASEHHTLARLLARSSTEDAIARVERAAELTLWNDPEYLYTLAVLRAQAGRSEEAIEPVERALAVCRELWGETVRHSQIDHLESMLVSILRSAGRNTQLALLIDERAERTWASVEDLERAAHLHSDESEPDWFDLTAALDYALRSRARSDTPARAVLLSWIQYRQGDLEAALQTVDEALAALRSAAGEEDASDLAAGFRERLGQCLAADRDGEEDGEWARAVLERLPAEERALLER